MLYPGTSLCMRSAHRTMGTRYMYTLTPRSPPRASTRQSTCHNHFSGLYFFNNKHRNDQLPSQHPVTHTCDTHGIGPPHSVFAVGIAASTHCQTPPHPSLRSHRKHDKLQLHPPPVSLRLILCVLKHKAQPRAICPVQSQPWVSRMPCFPRRRGRPSLSYCLDCQAVRVNRAGHLRYRSACTACPISTPDRGETPRSPRCPVRVIASNWSRARRHRAGLSVPTRS